MKKSFFCQIILLAMALSFCGTAVADTTENVVFLWTSSIENSKHYTPLGKAMEGVLPDAIRDKFTVYYAPPHIKFVGDGVSNVYDVGSSLQGSKVANKMQFGNPKKSDWTAADYRVVSENVIDLKRHEYILGYAARLVKVYRETSRSKTTAYLWITSNVDAPTALMYGVIESDCSRSYKDKLAGSLLQASWIACEPKSGFTMALELHVKSIKVGTLRASTFSAL